MKDITPLQDKLGRIDPDDVLTHVASGGSFEDYAKQVGIRYADLYKYIMSIPDGEKKFDIAIKAAEHRDRDLVVRSLRGVIETYPVDMFEEDGSLKPVSEWPKELLAGFEIEEIYSKGDAVGNVKKIKTVDRLRAMELLGKERGMFVNRTKVDATLTLEQLVEQSTKGVKNVTETGSADGVHEGQRGLSGSEIGNH